MSSPLHQEQPKSEEALPNPEKPEPPLGSPEKPEPPLGSPEKPKPPLGSPEKPKPPLGSPEKQEPPLGSPEKQEPPLGSPEKSEPPLWSPEKPKPPLRSPEIPKPPLGSPEKPKPPLGSREKQEPPLGSPEKSPWPAISPAINRSNREEHSIDLRYEENGKPENTSPDPETPELPLGLPEKIPSKLPSPAISPIVTRASREELSVVMRYEEKGMTDNRFSGDWGRGSRVVPAIVRQEMREKMVRRSELGFRVCGLVFSLVSLSVMASDRTQGWTGDSFYRYKQYRYCISVMVLAFAYSGFQVCRRINQIVTGKDIIRRPISCYFDFILDQVFAYLLISASSSAASRTDDWVFNWGDDKFTVFASASVAMSFLAFAAVALSCLISGYNLCHHCR